MYLYIIPTSAYNPILHVIRFRRLPVVLFFTANNIMLSECRERVKNTRQLLAENTTLPRLLLYVQRYNPYFFF